MSNERVDGGDINYGRKYRGNSKFEGENNVFLEVLNLSGLWDIPVKKSCVENGNLGLILGKGGWAGVELCKCWPTGDG